MASIDMMISTNEVNKEYRREGAIIRALIDITVDIKSGEFVCIQGPTGCGKSTLLNVISGLDLPDSGKVIFDPGRSKSSVNKFPLFGSSMFDKLSVARD